MRKKPRMNANEREQEGPALSGPRKIALPTMKWPREERTCRGGCGFQPRVCVVGSDLRANRQWASRPWRAMGMKTLEKSRAKFAKFAKGRNTEVIEPCFAGIEKLPATKGAKNTKKFPAETRNRRVFSAGFGDATSCRVSSKLLPQPQEKRLTRSPQGREGVEH